MKTAPEILKEIAGYDPDGFFSETPPTRNDYRTFESYVIIVYGEQALKDYYNQTSGQ